MAKRQYNKGQFYPKNPQKYCGPNVNNIVWRSLWESRVMQTLDDHPSFLHWSSESISIDYYNPVLKKKSKYIPDFFVVWADQTGKQHAEIWEIKPQEEDPRYISEKFSKNTKANYKLRLVRAINEAKWAAALNYCKQRGYKFRIITEKELFGFTRKP